MIILAIHDRKQTQNPVVNWLLRSQHIFIRKPCTNHKSTLEPCAIIQNVASREQFILFLLHPRSQELKLPYNITFHLISLFLLPRSCTNPTKTIRILRMALTRRILNPKNLWWQSGIAELPNQRNNGEKREWRTGEEVFATWVENESSAKADVFCKKCV